MSHDHHEPLPAQGKADFGKLIPVGGIMLLVGGGLSAMAYGQGQAQFFQSYLFGFVFWMLLTLGCYGLVLLHHTVRGQWSVPLLRIWEAGGGATMLITMAVLFAPVVLGLSEIYHWTDKHAPFDKLLEAKRWWLNDGFFVLRQGVYWLVWIVTAWVLKRSSLREDKTRDTNEAIRRTNISAPSILLFLLMVTVCWTDWVMSIEAHWYSTLWGALFMVYQGLIGLSFGTIVFLMNAKKEPYNLVVNPKVTKDLGNMMFAFTMLWGYLTISQYLIIYSANLPEETTYYVFRTDNSWNLLGAFVVLFSFFVPFLLLLAPRIKAATNTLLVTAGLIFVVRIFDVFWLVAPAFHHGEAARTTFGVRVGDIGSWLLVGGVWLAVFATQLKKANLLPLHDPRLPEGVPQHVA